MNVIYLPNATFVFYSCHGPDTGLTRPERVSSLLTVVSVAFIWACVTGEVVASRTVTKVGGGLRKLLRSAK